MFGLVQYEIFNFCGSGAEFGWRCQVVWKKTLCLSLQCQVLAALGAAFTDTQRRELS